MFRLSLAVLAAALFDCSGLHAESEAAQSVKPTPVIFDTDITGDCDDVLALAMLHALQDRLMEMSPEQAIRVIEVQRALSSQPPRHSLSQ
ncbi:hypothetical protein [Rhodopirellula bahusiensis]